MGNIEEKQTNKIITNNDVLGGNKQGLKPSNTIREGDGHKGFFKQVAFKLIIER